MHFWLSSDVLCSAGQPQAPETTAPGWFLGVLLCLPIASVLLPVYIHCFSNTVSVRHTQASGQGDGDRHLGRVTTDFTAPAPAT